MRINVWRTGLVAVCLSVATLFFPGCAGLGPVSKDILAEPLKSLAITNVGLISLEAGVPDLQTGMTVLVENGLIAAAGLTGDIEVPAGFDILDGGSMYLMPGIIDMHVHISDDGDMLKFLKFGVTTVRHMAEVPFWTKALGFSDVLSLRKKQREGRILGPDIFTAGFCLDGRPPVSPLNKVVATPAAAAAAVRADFNAGYDFIKIYDMLSVDVFDAIVASAEGLDIPVIGHVPFAVGLDRILASSVHSIEHMTGYINNNKAALEFPRENLDGYVVKTKESGIYNCPTAVIWDNIPSPGRLSDLGVDPEYAYMRDHVLWLWKTAHEYYFDNEYPEPEGYTAHMMGLSLDVLGALYGGGCPLMIGTDANIIGVYPGISALREMELFVEAGVSEMDTLVAACRTGAEALGKASELGSVAVGKKANLLLLRANPLINISAVRDQAGVVIGGRWLSRDTLDALVDKYYGIKP